MITAALLCTFCFLTTPNGVPYVEGPGTYRSIWSPVDDQESNGFAAGLTRTGGTGRTVAGQFNAHAGWGVNSQTWGIATEAVALSGSYSILVGAEVGVVNQEYRNDSAKIGVNIVWSSEHPNANRNSVGLWFTSTPNTGFESAIKLDRYSIHAYAKAPAVLDLSDMDYEQLLKTDLIKLPNGKAIRWNGSSLYVVSY